MERLERVNIRLSREEKEKLKSMAKRAGLSISDIIRTAVNVYEPVLDKEIGRRLEQGEKLKWWR